MLPCATTAVIGIIDDGSGSVPRMSLACRGRKRFGLCPTAGFLANGPVVPSTRLSNGQNGRVEPYECQCPSKCDSKAHQRPVTCASFVMIKCHASPVQQGKRLGLSTWLDRNERGFPTRKFETPSHQHLTANNCNIHFVRGSVSSSGTRTWMHAISLICRDSPW